MKKQRFGGPWTTQKVEMIRKYLEAYVQALKFQNFNLSYIDAFAGTGHYYIKDREEESIRMDGSAKVALEISRPFKTYYFIDKDSDKLSELQELVLDYSNLGSDFVFRNGDANENITMICNQVDWSDKRAVMFLDPFGLQVSWKTIQAIAATRAIDLWFLFPIFGINRMLKKNGKINEEWSAKLDDVFGTHDWYNEFYQKSAQMSLFDLTEEYKKTTDFGKITKYIVRRLNTEFPAVHPRPRIFKSSSNSPLFALCFAIGNESEAAKKLALKIAGHILESRDGVIENKN